MIRIEIDTHQFERALNELQTRISNLRPALDEIGTHIVSEIDLNFRDASDPYGYAWEPLKHRSGVPLNDTGRLKNSITHNVTHNAVEIGSNTEYAITHQLGAKKGQYNESPPILWGDIPARPFLPIEAQGLPQAWKLDIIDIISNHLNDALR